MADQSGCYLILSLDGGGVRGALQARVLQRLEAMLPFLHNVELISGSSIGGLSALMFAAGRTPDDLVELFTDRTDEIFRSRDWWDTIAGPADELFRADYDNTGLKALIKEQLGTLRLADLNKKVTITSFVLDNQAKEKIKTSQTNRRRYWKPKIFHNFESPGGDGSELVVDVGLRTTAAPTLFPSYQGYVDGGIVANNPSLCALGRAVKSGVPQDQIVMLSLGTGFNPAYIEGDRLDWGYKQWFPHLIPMLMDGMVGLPDYICGQLLPKRYVRVHPILTEDIPLDAVDRIDDLVEWADDVDLGPAIDLLASLPA